MIFHFLWPVIDATPKDHCINNNNVRTPNGNHLGSQTGVFVSSVNTATLNPTKALHQPVSVPVQVPEDGNVLKKVISYTLDQLNNAENVSEKISRPSCIPQKLHFSAYEQFKGEPTFTSFLFLFISINLVATAYHLVY